MAAPPTGPRPSSTMRAPSFVRATAGAATSSPRGAQARASRGCCSCTPIRCWTPAGSARPASSWSASTAGARPARAAAFRFALDDIGRQAAHAGAAGGGCAARMLRLPYGDQGLLIPKRLYDEIGGYRPLPLMEDVDLVRRLGRRRVVMLRRARGDQRRALPPRGLRAPLRPQPDVPDALHAARAHPRHQPHLRVSWSSSAAHQTLREIGMARDRV